MSRGLQYPHVSRTRSAWIGALLALFMVFVLPACWFGALARAQELGMAAPSSSNNNEEREEHEEREIATRDAQGNRPPPPPPVATRAERARGPIVAPTFVVAPVAHPLELSVLSVRRLL